MAQDSKVYPGEMEGKGSTRSSALPLSPSVGLSSAGGGSCPRATVLRPAAALSLTRRWRLELGLLLGIPGAEDFGWGLLPTLDFALKGEQVLNILLFQGAGRAARRANTQVGRQLTPLLVLINLAKKRAGWWACSRAGV